MNRAIVAVVRVVGIACLLFSLAVMIKDYDYSLLTPAILSVLLIVATYSVKLAPKKRKNRHGSYNRYKS